MQDSQYPHCGMKLTLKEAIVILDGSDTSVARKLDWQMVGFEFLQANRINPMKLRSHAAQVGDVIGVAVGQRTTPPAQ